MIKIYQGNNEGDPHQEIETSKDIIEALFPILSLRRGDDVLAESLHPTSYRRGFQTLGRRGRKPLIHNFNWYSVDVDFANGIRLVSRRFGHWLLFNVN